MVRESLFTIPWSSNCISKNIVRLIQPASLVAQMLHIGARYNAHKFARVSQIPPASNSMVEQVIKPCTSRDSIADADT